MDKSIAWELFMDTGAPEAYLLYHMLNHREEIHVPDDSRTGTPCNGLQ